MHLAKGLDLALLRNGRFVTVILAFQCLSFSQTPRRSPFLTKSIPKIQRATSAPLQTVDTVDQTCWREEPQARGDSSLPAPSEGDGSIHVYAHKNGDVTVHAVSVDSDEVSMHHSHDC